ncbi:MAG: pyridoxamine 5'-phosphate oxidase family protein [SAR324 cluster bacterium]|nr:pyridoxamine 5'-phosphate oxidase family protein [SAR324 cluster bacterium]
MRRKEKEIVDKKSIEKVIRACLVCRLAIIDGDYPYIVPLNFGYSEGVLYFHGALKGKKLSLLQKNNQAAFEFDTRLEIVEGEEACKWSMKFQSVCGFGKVSMIETPQEKKRAVERIMAQYSEQAFELTDKAVSGIAVYKLEIEQMTGKQSGW